MRRLQPSFGFLVAAILLGGLLGSALLVGWLQAALASDPASDDPAAPKFSTFASAADLSAELKILVADLQKAVLNKAEYDSQVEHRFTRDGNLIALVATAVGLHDEDSPLKPRAKAIAAAARKLAQAKDYPSNKAGRRGSPVGHRRHWHWRR